MQKISSKEQDAIKLVISLSERYGYKNMISHISSALIYAHMKNFKIPEEKAALMNPEYMNISYPIKMHLDIMNNGEWDETGERYNNG